MKETTNPVTAEFHTRKLGDNSVERARYTATISVPDRSLAGVMQLLAETCSANEDFKQALETDEHVVLNIQIRV